MNYMKLLTTIRHNMPKVARTTFGYSSIRRDRHCTRRTFWQSIGLLFAIACVIFIPQYFFYKAIPNVLVPIVITFDLIASIIILWQTSNLWLSRMNDAGVDIYRLVRIELAIGIPIWLCYLIGANHTVPFSETIWLPNIRYAYDGIFRIIAYILYASFYLLTLAEVLLCFKSSKK